MATRRVSQNGEENVRRYPAARSSMKRENQLITQAVDLAEKQIQDGTASVQVLVHYLKLASSRERLEQERLANEVELLKIKRETIAAQQRVEDLYREAMDAFRAYSPEEASPEEDFYGD